MSMNQTFKTGEVAPVSGVYEYVRHTEFTTCQPSQAERLIPLARGERFPPHRSCGRGVVWRLARRA
jgi:hypothetical protein